MNERRNLININDKLRLSRDNQNDSSSNRTEEPEKSNHLFDSHRAFHGKDDVRRLNNLLKRLKSMSGEGGFDSAFGNNPGGRMRATYHSGRTHSKSRKAFSAKHNDRNFDSEADHIVQDKTGNNIEWNWCGNEFSFDEGEQKFYEEVFSEQLNFSNQVNLKQGHKERIKTMEQWRKNKQHCPEETIIQIGKMGNHPDVETSVRCFKEFIAWLESWNRHNSSPFKVLNWALHQDEQGAPHFHLRKVWYYKDDEKGFFNTGQEAALRKTSLELPDPDKKEGKKNNRKMIFDKMCREKWITIARVHGLEIEDTPKPKDEVGFTLEEYKRRQDQEQREIFKELVQFAELNVAMAEKVSEWEETARTVDNADAFLTGIMKKAFRTFTDEGQQELVDEVKGYYASEAKKKEEEHRKQIAEYERQLHPAPVVKKERDVDVER